MKSLFLVVGILFIAAPAHAKDADIEQCIGTMMNNPEVTRAKAEYACNNPYLEYRETDTKEQEAMRRELAEDGARAHEENMRKYHEEQKDEEFLRDF